MNPGAHTKVKAQLEWGRDSISSTLGYFGRPPAAGRDRLHLPVGMTSTKRFAGPASMGDV